MNVLKRLREFFGKHTGVFLGNYMFKVNNANARTRCEIYSKLTMEQWRQWRCSDVFIVNFEHISHLDLCFYC